MSTPTTPKRKTHGYKSESKETAKLVNAGRKSATNAIRASKALGLDITYMRDGIVYKEKPNGEKRVFLKVAVTSKGPKNHVQLKKGMIFNIN